jgi:hypothetical protein
LLPTSSPSPLCWYASCLLLLLLLPVGFGYSLHEVLFALRLLLYHYYYSTTTTTLFYAIQFNSIQFNSIQFKFGSIQRYFCSLSVCAILLITTYSLLVLDSIQSDSGLSSNFM